jgi:hypothetical protein
MTAEVSEAADSMGSRLSGSEPNAIRTVPSTAGIVVILSDVELVLPASLELSVSLELLVLVGLTTSLELLLTEVPEHPAALSISTAAIKIVANLLSFFMLVSLLFCLLQFLQDTIAFMLYRHGTLKE